MECKIRALRRHKSLLPNSAEWWRVGQVARCSLWSVEDKCLCDYVGSSSVTFSFCARRLQFVIFTSLDVVDSFRSSTDFFS